MEDPREVSKPLVEGRLAAGAVTACPVTAGGRCDPCPESRRAPQRHPQCYNAPQTHPSPGGSWASPHRRGAAEGSGGVGGRVFRAALTRNWWYGGQTRALLSLFHTKSFWGSSHLIGGFGRPVGGQRTPSWGTQARKGVCPPRGITAGNWCLVSLHE